MRTLLSELSVKIAIYRSGIVFTQWEIIGITRLEPPGIQTMYDLKSQRTLKSDELTLSVLFVLQLPFDH